MLKFSETQVRLLTGHPDTPMHIRLIHDSERSAPASKLYGTVRERWREIERGQDAGYGVFIVVNGGGDDDASITNFRAVFIDADGRPRYGTDKSVHNPSRVMRLAGTWHLKNPADPKLITIEIP